MEFLAAHGAALLFYLFGGLALAAAFIVVTQRNPMYAAMALLVSFLAVAALFLMRHAEFLSIVQIFVYGGGIMVLFLFVIMLVNLHRLREIKIFGANAGIGLLVALLLAGVLTWVFAAVELPVPDAAPPALVEVEGEALGNSQAIAWSLYREYLLPFEIASVFLLVAMIGAVVLARRD